MYVHKYMCIYVQAVYIHVIYVCVYVCVNIYIYIYKSYILEIFNMHKDRKATLIDSHISIT